MKHLVPRSNPQNNRQSKHRNRLGICKFFKILFATHSFVSFHESIQYRIQSFDSFPFFESTSHICFNAYTAARAPFSAFSRRFRCFPRPPRRCNHPHPPRRRLRPLLAASSPSPSRPRAFSAILSACFGTIPAITNGSPRWKLAFCLFVEINPSFLIRVKYYSQN